MGKFLNEMPHVSEPTLNVEQNLPT